MVYIMQSEDCWSVWLFAARWQVEVVACGCDTLYCTLLFTTFQNVSHACFAYYSLRTQPSQALVSRLGRWSHQLYSGSIALLWFPAHHSVSHIPSFPAYFRSVGVERAILLLWTGAFSEMREIQQRMWTFSVNAIHSNVICAVLSCSTKRNIIRMLT